MTETDKKKNSTESKKLLVLATVVMSFTGLCIIVIYLGRSGIITVPAAILMLIALVGIYVGFGILIAAHLMVKKLEE